MEFIFNAYIKSLFFAFNYGSIFICLKNSISYFIMIENFILSDLHIFLYFLELYLIYKILSKFLFKWNCEMTNLPLGPPVRLNPSGLG